MNLPYYYWYFLSALPAEFCDKILEIGLTTLHERKEKYGSASVNASVGGWRQKPTGDQNSKPINEMDVYESLENGIIPKLLM